MDREPISNLGLLRKFLDLSDEVHRQSGQVGQAMSREVILDRLHELDECDRMRIAELLCFATDKNAVREACATIAMSETEFAENIHEFLEHSEEFGRRVQ